MWHLGTTLPPVIIGAFEGNDQIQKEANWSKCMWNKFLEAIVMNYRKENHSHEYILRRFLCMKWLHIFFPLTLHGPFFHLLIQKKSLEVHGWHLGQHVIHANATMIIIFNLRESEDHNFLIFSFTQYTWSSQ